MLVRRHLFASGFRYRLHGGREIGSPDLFFNGQKVAVYIHGCFWHQHPGCKFAATVKSDSNRNWAGKLQKNRERDARNVKTAQDSGYSVAIVWECALEPKKKQSQVRQKTLETLCTWLSRNERAGILEI